MLNIVTELQEGGLETRHFKGLFLSKVPFPVSLTDFRKKVETGMDLTL